MVAKCHHASVVVCNVVALMPVLEVGIHRLAGKAGAEYATGTGGTGKLYSTRSGADACVISTPILEDAVNFFDSSGPFL